MLRKVPAVALFLGACTLLLSLPALPHLLRGDAAYGLSTDVAVPAMTEWRHGGNELTIVAFGFLQCGTVCPLQWLNLRDLSRALDGQPVNLVFVTLDPERDGREALRRFVAELGPNVAAHRPESAHAAQNMALAYRDYAARRPDDRSYTIDHSGRLYVVDRQSRLKRIYTSPLLDIGRVVSDIQALLAHQAARNFYESH